jgi:basic membrane protein A
MQYAIEKTMAGEAFEADWSRGFNEGSVALTELNEAVAAEGTQEKLDEVIAALKAGELHVFDTATFTVNGEVPENEHIYDGYFHESETSSAPYFDLTIDGITRLDNEG